MNLLEGIQDLLQNIGTMVSAQCEPIYNGDLGQSPQQGQEAVGGHGALPPEAESLLTMQLHTKDWQKVKDLSDSSPSCPRQTASCSHE